MTKDTYFEMCEAIGTEPVDSEIPVEYSDLPVLTQQTLNFYRLLRDIWDPMGGNFLGKDMSLIFEIFKLYDVPKEEQLLHITFIQKLDSIRSKLIATKKANTQTDKPSQPKP